MFGRMRDLAFDGLTVEGVWELYRGLSAKSGPQTKPEGQEMTLVVGSFKLTWGRGAAE